MRMRRRLLLLCAASVLLAACGSGAKEQQLVYRKYGINCLQERNYEEAAEYFQKALDQSIGKVSAVEIDTCYYKAQAQYQSGDTRGAIETYTAIINYNQDPQAYYLRGRLYYSIGTEEERASGDADFAAAVESGPEDYDLYIGICEAIGGKAGGTAYLEKALKIEGDEPRDHMQRGRIYHLLGDDTKARELLEQALSEEQVQANLYLTEVYQALGDDEGSERAFEAYLKSGLTDAEGLYNLGMIQMKAAEYERAVKCFEEALTHEVIWNRQLLEKTRITAYEFAGDFQTAKKLMTEYHRLYPRDTSMEEEWTFLQTR